MNSSFFRLTRRTFTMGAICAAGSAAARAKPTDSGRCAAYVFSASYLNDGTLTLPNTNSDGDLMAATLTNMGIASVARSRNPRPETFNREFSQFLARLNDDLIGIIYLSGHGVQLGVENYLLLEDGKTFLHIASVIQAARAVSPAVVLFLDACRTDPTKTSQLVSERARAIVIEAKTGGKPGDLATFQFVGAPDGEHASVGVFQLQGSGVKIVFATDPQNTALDGATVFSRNSPFATALAARLTERKSLDDIIALVTRDVLVSTDGMQSPWTQGSLGEPLFLSGPPANKNTAKPPFQVPG